MMHIVAIGAVGVVSTALIFLLAGLPELVMEMTAEQLRERARLGYVFLAEPIAAGEAVDCGCLAGLPALFNVSGGVGANGALCIQCVRTEFSAWALRQVTEKDSALKLDGGCRPAVAGKQK
jgi:hypothetical protein